MPEQPLHSERELLFKIAEGNEKAFGELFRLYVPRLEPFVHSITKNQALVDEVIQESFVRIWMNRERLAEIEYPKTWIYRIVSYVCFHYLRQQARHRKAISTISNQEQNNSPTENFLVLKDLEKIIRQGMNRLTPAQQRIYRLSREEGLKIPEIAEKLGISANTVKNTLVTSLRSIREYAANEGFTLSLFLLWLIV